MTFSHRQPDPSTAISEWFTGLSPLEPYTWSGFVARRMKDEDRLFGGRRLREDMFGHPAVSVAREIHQFLEPDGDWPTDQDRFSEAQWVYLDAADGALHCLGIDREYDREEGTLKATRLLQYEDIGPKVTMVLRELAVAAAKQNALSGDQASVPLDAPTPWSGWFTARFVLGVVEYLQSLGVIVDWQWDEEYQEPFVQLREPTSLDISERGAQDLVRERRDKGMAFEARTRRGRPLRPFPDRTESGGSDAV